MQTPVDRARVNALRLIDDSRRIISAAECGTLTNLSIEEIDRYKALIADHEALLEMYA